MENKKIKLNDEKPRAIISPSFLSCDFTILYEVILKILYILILGMQNTYRKWCRLIACWYYGNKIILLKLHIYRMGIIHYLVIKNYI